MRRLHRPTRDRVLDEHTADRLADGILAVDDAPPGFQAVAGVIGQLGAPATDAERVGGDEVVASMLAVVSLETGQPPIPRRAPMTKRTFARLAAVSTVGAMSLFGALGAANALPGAAQDIASNMLSPLGLDVGNPNPNAAPHPDTRGQSASHDEAADTNSEDATNPDDASNPSDASGSSRTDGLTQAAGNVTNPTASAVLDTLTTGTPGPGLGSSVADAASGGADHVPTSVPASLPPAASNGEGSDHVPTSVPPQKP